MAASRQSCLELDREIIVQDSSFDPEVKATPADMAWLCEEARRAMEPGLALLSEGLDALHKLNP